MSYRYIYFGGTREKNADGSIRQIGVAHNSAFQLAAENVKRDYEGFSETVVLKKITTAAEMLNEINYLKAGNLKSLDILSHGTPYSLNFSLKENENSGLVTSFMAKMVLKAYYSDFFDWEIYNFGLFSRYVDDINFNIFAKDARVQIHGCNTARGDMPGNTFAEAISEGLWNAGKKDAYVIAHTDKSNPNINGRETTITEQDYRHGNRAIIRNGKVVYDSNEKGYLDHKKILMRLSSSYE